MRVRCLLLIAPFALWPIAGQAAPTPVDLILTNGKVFTADPARPAAEAIAISGERIVTVGTASDVAALAGEKTRTIDLQQRVVTPGFNDAHAHFGPDPKGFEVRFETNEPTWTETHAAIERAVQQAPPGTWIFAQVGYTVVLDEQVTRFVLDKLAPDHPVLLRAYYGHGYVANSSAMALLHIANNEPDPAGGYYERVADSREINGRYWEYAQWKTTRALASAVSDDEIVTALHELSDSPDCERASRRCRSFPPCRWSASSGSRRRAICRSACAQSRSRQRPHRGATSRRYATWTGCNKPIRT